MATRRQKRAEQIILDTMRFGYDDFEKNMLDDPEERKKVLEGAMEPPPQEEKMLSYAEKRERFDLTAGKKMRMQSAAVAYWGKAQEELGDLCDEEQLAHTWGFAACQTLMGGYDHRNESGYPLLCGAAIWIMEQLERQGKLGDLLRALPEQIIHSPLREGAKEPAPFIPIFQHPNFSSWDIIKFVELLAFRNAELITPTMVACSMTDEWTVSFQRKPTDGCPQRKVFESVMNMLDENAVHLAVEHFEEKVWEFFRLAFRINQIMEKALERMERQLQRIEEQLEAESRRGTPTRGPQNVMLNFGMLGQPSIRENQLLRERRDLERRYDELLKKTIGGLFTELALPNDREKKLNMLKSRLPEELYTQMLHFSVDDPNEICFALLYLLDQGSDLPWLTYGSRTVVYMARDQLPFSMMPDIEETITDQLPISEMQRLYQPVFASDGKYPDETDADDKPIHREYGCNLAQLLFQHTGTLWPNHEAKPLPEALRNALKQQEEAGVDVYQMLLEAVRDGHYREFTSALLKLRPEDQEEMQEPHPAEEALPQLVQHQQEMKKLRAHVHEVEKQNQTLQKEKASLQNSMEKMRQELAELRENVYHCRNDKDEENELEQEGAVVFPYHTTSKLLSFGGHPSWLKSIRALLPDVRFIPSDRQPDETAIRNADAIWLQPNCMSHSDFYKIITIVRNENKPLHYFSWVSAERCALQLAAAEKKG